MRTLVTIILGTNRAGNVGDFIGDLEKKTFFPEQVEVIFSVDKGDSACIDAIKNAQSISKLKIKYLEGVRSRGYFEANIHYNECLHLADKDSQFFAVFSDKLKIKTNGWDEKLKGYLGCFEDGLFRVRVSCFKNLRYGGNIFDAISKPDNFAFHSRKFIELSEGWGDFWGPDSWAQGIVFFCEMFGLYDRDIVASDIDLESYFYSSSSGATKSSLLRSRMINWSFKFLSTSDLAISNFCRVAMKMKLYTECYDLTKFSRYSFSYRQNSVAILNDKRVEIASRFIDDLDNFNVKIFMNQRHVLSLINSSKRIKTRKERFEKSRIGIKKLVLFLNLKVTEFKAGFSKFFEVLSFFLRFIFASKSRSNWSINLISESDQFAVYQNELIEKEIRAEYYRVIKEVG
jgi:hypothetical protein